MAVTETTTESWGSRLGGAFKGILVGLGLFLVAFPVLFTNEGRTVKTRKALEEGEGACLSVESNKTVDPELEGALVHMTGVPKRRTSYVPNAETRRNPLNTRDVAQQPRIGDTRVTFRQIAPHDISLVARQKGDTFVAYKARNGEGLSP